MQSTQMARERLFTVRMSDEENKRLERVAESYGLNAAGVVRMLLKREADRLEHSAISAQIAAYQQQPAPLTVADSAAVSAQIAAMQPQLPQTPTARDMAAVSAQIVDMKRAAGRVHPIGVRPKTKRPKPKR